MHSKIAIWTLGLLAAVLLGFIAKWFFRHVRTRWKLNVSFQPQSAPAHSGSSLMVEKFERTAHSLSLKCECGTTWRFHETSGHADPDSQPMPAGDSFTCPNCGRAIDLSEARKLETSLKPGPQQPNRRS